MSEGAKKADDKMNMVGVVVVGICGAVLVYVSIVLLEAFYMNETSEVNVMADYGGQDTDVKSVKAAQMANINGYGKNQGTTFRISIDRAMDLVTDEAKSDSSNLIPAVGKSEKPTIQPVFGRPQPLGAGSGSAAPTPPPATPPTPPAEGSGSGSAAGSGSGSAAGSGSGSSAAAPQPTAGGAPAAGVAGSPTGSGSSAGSGSGSNGK